MPQIRLFLALLLLVILPIAVIARNSETTGYVTYYLHRTDLTSVSPLGKTMNATAPSIAETTLLMESGTYHYWYTNPPLTAGTISKGTWTLRVYVSWVGSGINKGTYEVNLVSLDGSTIRATLVYPTSGPTAKQGSFWYEISMDAASVTATEKDRVRLSLKFSKATTLYYDGNTGNEATEQSRLEFTGSAPPPIPESPFGVLAFALIAFTVCILRSRRILIKRMFLT